MKSLTFPHPETMGGKVTSLQLRELRPGVLNLFFQHHKARKWQSWGLNQGPLSVKPMFLIPQPHCCLRGHVAQFSIRFWELLYSPCQMAGQPLLAYLQRQRAHYLTGLQSRSLEGRILVPTPASSFFCLASTILWLPPPCTLGILPQKQSFSSLSSPSSSEGGVMVTSLQRILSLSLSLSHFLSHHSLFL